MRRYYNTRMEEHEDFLWFEMRNFVVLEIVLNDVGMIISCNYCEKNDSPLSNLLINNFRRISRPLLHRLCRYRLSTLIS